MIYIKYFQLEYAIKLVLKYCKDKNEYLQKHTSNNLQPIKDIHLYIKSIVPEYKLHFDNFTLNTWGSILFYKI